MTLANRVTLARIIFIPLLLVLLLYRINGLALILFLLLSFSDAIDGYVARKYHQVSDLGKFLDPLADKILVISVLIVLVAQNEASVVAALFLIARELIVQGIRIHTAKSGKILAASTLAKWKTTTEIIALALLILGMGLGNVVLWLAVVLSLFSGWIYLWQSKILDQLKLN